MTLAQVLTAGNDAAGQNISGIGTCTAANFAGDGSALTGIPAPGLTAVLDIDPSAGGRNISGVTTLEVQTLNLSTSVGFFGTPPVGQQAGAAHPAGTNYGELEMTMLNTIYDALSNLGFFAP